MPKDINTGVVKMEIIWQFLNILKIHLPNDTALLFLGIFPKTSVSHDRGTCSSMFTDALFTIARKQKQPRCPVTDE